MQEVWENVKCKVAGLCGGHLGGEGSLLALWPPQPQRPPCPQHRLLQAHLLLPLHRPHLPRHHRCRHHHHQTDRDYRLVSWGETKERKTILLELRSVPLKLVEAILSQRNVETKGQNAYLVKRTKQWLLFKNLVRRQYNWVIYSFSMNRQRIEMRNPENNSVFSACASPQTCGAGQRFAPILLLGHQVFADMFHDPFHTKSSISTHLYWFSLISSIFIHDFLLWNVWLLVVADRPTNGHCRFWVVAVCRTPFLASQEVVLIIHVMSVGEPD